MGDRVEDYDVSIRLTLVCETSRGGIDESREHGVKPESDSDALEWVLCLALWMLCELERTTL